MGTIKLNLAQVFCHPKMLQTIHVDMNRSHNNYLRMAHDQGTKCQYASSLELHKEGEDEISTRPPTTSCFLLINGYNFEFSFILAQLNSEVVEELQRSQ